jgi:CheY-like chemotaxis protein
MAELQKQILIIDDSVDIQILLSTLLTANGYIARCASNGALALSLMQDSIHLPDLIILDAQMPTMNGYEFREQQILNPTFSDIPVIVTTAERDLALDEKMLLPQAILRKPLEIVSLLEIIARLLYTKS